MQSRPRCGILQGEVTGRGRFFAADLLYRGGHGAGEVVISPRRPALVVAADAGLAHLRTRGITPDWIVGDFDSLGEIPEGVNVIRHPVEKDDTDMLLAVRTGLELGCREFVLYGGMGGRPDHTYANLQTLRWIAARGGRGYLVGEGMAATAVESSAIHFPAGLSGTISVFCPGEQAEGVTLRGLYYPLDQGVLTGEFPLGVSNRFTGAEASVSVERGCLLVMWQESAAGLVERLVCR